MPPTTTPTARQPARRKRGEGQWELGHREPLNPNERTKKDDDGLNVRARIETIYSQARASTPSTRRTCAAGCAGGASTPSASPGSTAAAPRVLEPEELDDEYFMLRVRIDGGALTTEQLRAIGEISHEFARDTADITDRQNIQYHWIRIEDVPEIWQRLEAVGLTTDRGVRRHAPRDPRLARRRHRRGRDHRPDARRSTRSSSATSATRSFSNLPRKFKTAISGPSRTSCTRSTTSPSSASSTPSTAPASTSGSAAASPPTRCSAQRLGVWVPLDEVPDVWEGVVSIFRDYGYRRLRTEARLKFLVADWGVEKFRQVLRGRVPRPHADRRPRAREPGQRPSDHVGVHKQKDGRNYVGVAPTVGPRLRHHARRSSPTSPRRRRLRPGPAHPAPEARRPRRPRRPGRRARGRARRRSACRPSRRRGGATRWPAPASSSASSPSSRPRQRAARLVAELEKRLADVAARTCPICHQHQRLPELLRPHPGRRHRPQGQIVTDADGNQVEGFQVHLGGGLGLRRAGFGRKLRGLKVTSAELRDYVERVVRRFVDQREAGETLRPVGARAAEADLK